MNPAFDPALKHLEDILRGLRAGRASPALLEDLTIDAYGTPLKLKEVARIATPDARTIHVEPWDRNLVKSVEKAIAASGLGVNPVTAGTAIRVPLPPLTEERRKELVKMVRKHAEDAKVTIRHVREKLLKILRDQHDANTLSDDAFEREKKQLQTEVDAAVQTAEGQGNDKEREILTL